MERAAVSVGAVPEPSSGPGAGGVEVEVLVFAELGEVGGGVEAARKNWLDAVNCTINFYLVKPSICGVTRVDY